MLHRGLHALTKRLFGGTALWEWASAFLHRKAGYSQFGEDLHLSAFYDRLAHDRGIRVTGGCVVDVGAFRPIVHSNTYLFYRKGWHGINIDPTPGSMRVFKKVRPHDTNLELAVAPSNGTGVFYLFGTPSVWNTMDAESAARAEATLGVKPRQVETQFRRLDSILDEHLRGRPLEILSIDAEGFDIEILQSNDFSRYRPRLILIEVHNVTADDLGTHPIVSYLREQDYHLHSWINPNLLFVRGDSLLEPEKTS